MQVLITPVTMFQQNCSLLWCRETLKGAIVDPGGDTGRVLAQAQKAGVTIEKLLITHAHIDHAGATAQLARELGVPIEGPQREDQFWIDLLPEQGARYGFAPAEAFVPDRWLEHGDTVTVGNLTLNVVHCPGHTPGHVVFFESQSQIAFVGDVLFQGSVGRTDFPRGDHATLIRSITERLWPLGDDVTFVPGHGPTSTFGQERKTNPYVADGALR
ncbi:MAG: MBL fold metallo-hydrolase [Gammaproteobacteria bacterium]|jgi:glyoxylase-like metal-dependent hydrolase (beta-lactamase superfamily II)|nr:MBL fold metallo-hydrolase [Gammaproteobacteria bacterium]